MTSTLEEQAIPNVKIRQEKRTELIVIGDGVDMYTDYYWAEAYSDSKFHIFNEMFKTPVERAREGYYSGYGGRREQALDKLLDKLRRMHLSLPLNKHFDMPQKSVWDSSSVLAEFFADVEDKRARGEVEEAVQYFVLFSTVSLHRANPKFVNHLKEKYGLILVCLSIDVFHHEDRMAGAVGRNFREINFDLRLNISKEQADLTLSDPDPKMHEHFQWNPYSRLEVTEEALNRASEQQVYFIGSDGTYRTRLLAEFAKILTSFNISKHFLIVANHDGDAMTPELVRARDEITDSDKYISPAENIANVQKSDVLLEILRYPTAYPTLRYFEAVVYNKKLITTNSDVVNLPFYDKRWIRIAKSVADFNSDLAKWIAEPARVDFGYNGEYSPQSFFEELQSKAARNFA